MSARYQPQLDGVRALGVLLVVVFHARSAFFPGGYIGVDVFFVLSGYLITGILVREIEHTGRLSLTHFYVRRALRLLPALGLVCTVVGILYLFLPGAQGRNATLLGTVAALTYTSSPLAASGHQLGAMLHTWSLSVEEYFYLIWPFALALIHRRHRWWHRALLALTILAIIYRFLGWSVLGWSIQRLSYGADTRFEQLLIGATLAVVLPRLGRQVPSWAALGAGLLLAAFVVLPPQITGEFYLRSGSTLIALLTALVIANLATRPHQWPARSLSWNPLVWIGQRSYGIYLWNPPLVALLALTAWADSIQLAVKLALTFIVPALSYAFLERPCLRLKARFQPAEESSSSAMEIRPATGGAGPRSEPAGP